MTSWKLFQIDKISPQGFHKYRKMDITGLPFETQVQFLLDLPEKDILSYCQTSQAASQICQSSWFWDQKGIRDFGYPPSLICRQSPHWLYSFVDAIMGEPGLLGPLVHSGQLDLAKRYVDESDPSDLIIRAIEYDDIVTLKFLEPTILQFKGDEPFYYWLKQAFYYGSPRAVQYLVALEPGYLKDSIILEDILEELTAREDRRIRGIKLFHPYIEEYLRTFPQILEEEDLPVLEKYVQENFPN